MAKANSKMNDTGDKHNRASKNRKWAKQRGDAVESLLRAAGAVREQQATPSLTLFGELQPQFHAGDTVQVRIEDGSWRVGLRAVSDIEEIENRAGTPQKVIRVSWEDEWQAAQREGREPISVPWPYEQVEFWEPGLTSDRETENLQQPAEHRPAALPFSFVGGRPSKLPAAPTKDAAKLSKFAAKLSRFASSPGGTQARNLGLPHGRGDRYVPHRKACPFCVDRVEEIDYKDVAGLRRYLSERNKLESRRKTGICARHQRGLRVAIKRARHMALLPYVGLHANNTVDIPDKD
jgi:small subunit ribosomal protein S18